MPCAVCSEISDALSAVRTCCFTIQSWLLYLVRSFAFVAQLLDLTCQVKQLAWLDTAWLASSSETFLTVVSIWRFNVYVIARGCSQLSSLFSCSAPGFGRIMPMSNTKRTFVVSAICRPRFSRWLCTRCTLTTKTSGRHLESPWISRNLIRTKNLYLHWYASTVKYA